MLPTRRILPPGLKEIVLLCLIVVFPAAVKAQALNSDFYEIGDPAVTDYYVDPVSGSDSNSGLSVSKPRRTVTSIWNQIPANSVLTSGYRINLLPGIYSSDHLPNYWENRLGSANAPVILTALSGYGGVFFTRDINMAGVKYFYLIGVDIKNRLESGVGDAFHCERCDHILLRENSFNGAPEGRNSGQSTAHETIKFNQSQHIYIENNNIQGADDNGIDWVAVQYGHIRGNRIHDTQGWCAYVKGGSSYVLIESNLIYNCGEGGVTAGQGTGFEFMESPWLRFEANYVKIVNNIIHDVEGAALGVNGGYGILLAHNTAYRIGSRSHLLEIVFGERTCDGDSAACVIRTGQGGWGPVLIGGDHSQPIGNREVLVFNNVFFNPPGMESGFQHLAVYAPRTPTASGIPSPQRSDTGLVFKGNVFRNGGSSMPLGIGDGEGCADENPTCNPAGVAAFNSVNSITPDFITPGAQDFRPAEGGVLAGQLSFGIDAFPGIDNVLNPIPEGERGNILLREFSGAGVLQRPPGAIAGSSSAVTFPVPEGGRGTPPGSGEDGNDGPLIKSIKLAAVKTKSGAKLKFTVKASDPDGIMTVQAIADAKGTQLGSFALTAAKQSFKGKGKIRTRAKKVKVRIEAADSRGARSIRSKSIKIR